MGEQTYTTGVRRKRLLWGILAVVLVVVGAVGIWAYRVGSALAGKNGGGLKKVFQAYQDPRSLFPGRDRITVLVLGKDYNRDRKGMPYTKGSRSDTMMVIGVDLVTPKITAVSIPRDTKITAADGVTDKMNSVIVRGGPQLVIDTLSQHFGISPDYYVVLKPDAVRSIVDAVGGVDVVALDDMNYDDSWGQLHVHIAKGPAHLDGAGAEGFVRFRKTSGRRSHAGSNLEEGDLRRAARQQQLIHALVQAAMRPSNLASAPSIIETGFKQVETNMTQPQLLALSRLFQQAGGGQIEGGTLPGDDSKDSPVYYWIIDEARSREMFAWLIQGDPSAERALPRVAVYNSSKTGAAARSIASMLYAEGYDAFNGGGRPPFATVSQITFRASLYQPQAEQLATRLGLPPPAKDQKANPLDTWSPEISIIVGEDLATKFKPIAGVNDINPPPSRRHKRKSSQPSTPPTPDVSVDSQPGVQSDSTNTTG